MSTHKDKKIFAMTTAIAYASGKPHIGNTYEIIMADAIARFKRFEGYDVFFHLINIYLIINATKVGRKWQTHKSFIQKAIFWGRISVVFVWEVCT